MAMKVECRVVFQVMYCQWVCDLIDPLTRAVFATSRAATIGIFGLWGHKRVCLSVENILEEC